MLSIGFVVSRALSTHPTWPWPFVVVWVVIGAAGALLLSQAALREDPEIPYLRSELTMAHGRLEVANVRHAGEIRAKDESYERLAHLFGTVKGMTATGIISGNASSGPTGPAGPVPDGRTVQVTAATVATGTAHATGEGVNPTVTTVDNVSEVGGGEPIEH